MKHFSDKLQTLSTSCFGPNVTKIGEEKYEISRESKERIKSRFFELVNDARLSEAQKIHAFSAYLHDSEKMTRLGNIVHQLGENRNMNMIPYLSTHDISKASNSGKATISVLVSMFEYIKGNGTDANSEQPQFTEKEEERMKALGRRFQMARKVMEDNKINLKNDVLLAALLRELKDD